MASTQLINITGGSQGGGYYLWFYYSAPDYQKLAQSFTLSNNKDIDQVKGYFAHVLSAATGFSSGTLNAEIRTDNSGLPSNTVLGTSGNINASTIGSSATECTFTFSEPVSLSASTTYWVVFNAQSLVVDGTLSDFDTLESFIGSGLYADGKFAYYTSGSWNDAGGPPGSLDMRLQIWGDDPAPSIPTNVTGVVSVPNTGGTITLTEDMAVSATGDLTLEVSEISNLLGGKAITVQPGGKIKLTNGRQITVLPGTLYRLLT